MQNQKHITVNVSKCLSLIILALLLKQASKTFQFSAVETIDKNMLSVMEIFERWNESDNHVQRYREDVYLAFIRGVVPFIFASHYAIYEN
ncbi:hypothetical protein T4D_5852 [Trichinella pseudospiralis]|uniref:Uncharacterized protein n=1 Tax=Trichinella pseudospiralis TaxID=6337 RepID=A0A0V1F7X9_TRIPS|nr:hypothetical protein T4D_5852 [Trichinella pseudospiralis]